MKKLISFSAILVLLWVMYSFIFDRAFGLSGEDTKSYSVIKTSATRLAKKYDLSPACSGLGYNNGFWLMTIGFSRYGSLIDQEEARRLIVECTEEFLADINADEAIRPLLRDYPFSPANVHVTIINQKPDGNNVYDPAIGAVSVYEGRVSYSTNSPHKLSYERSMYETYEEAQEILRKEQMRN